jgi:hypothetical protein
MNRDVMGNLISRSCDLHIRNKIETTHNYIDDRDFIIRKGAIRSYKGELMIIPFNMKDGSWIVEGKSNPLWNCSAPHGAGRVMSRTQAKKDLDLINFIREMNTANVYSSSVCKETLDEAPGAYKPAKVIQEAIGDTATIIHQLKPVYNLKSSEENSFGRKKKNKLLPGGNDEDSVWSRVKQTLKPGTVTQENESDMKEQFRSSPRSFCNTYREE